MADTDDLAASSTSPPLGDALLRFLSGLGQLGLRGLLPLARAYVGAAAATSNQTGEGTLRAASSGDDLRILGLAAMKLAFEAGDLAYRNPTLAPDRALPAFALDERGNGPDLSLAHVLALRQVWAASRARAAPAEVEVLAPRVDARTFRTNVRANRYSFAATAPEALAMAAPYSTTQSRTTSNTSTRSCCGGSSSSPATTRAASAPAYDHAATARRTQAAGCGCGGACSSGATATKTYGGCPTLRVSCETKDKLRESVKTAICDFLRCFADTYCPDGKFDPKRFNDKSTQASIYECFGQLACSLVHSVPEALCPPEPCPPGLPPADHLPCDYAVETTR